MSVPVHVRWTLTFAETGLLREWTGTDGLAGMVVSSTIVSLTFTETNPLASLNWALTVFVPSPAGLSVIGSVMPGLYACHGSPPTKFGEAALTWVTSLAVFGKVRETAVVLVPALPPLIRTVPVGGESRTIVSLTGDAEVFPTASTNFTYTVLVPSPADSVHGILVA